jgi:hypothetical protein
VLPIRGRQPAQSPRVRYERRLDPFSDLVVRRTPVRWSLVSSCGLPACRRRRGRAEIADYAPGYAVLHAATDARPG